MQLVRIAKGKRYIIETGSRKKLQARMKQLRSSTMRGVSGRTCNKYRVEYKIEEEDEDEEGKDEDDELSK